MIFTARRRFIPGNSSASLRSSTRSSSRRARRIVDADRKLLRDFLKQQSGLFAVWTKWGTTSFPRLLSGNADDFLERLRSQFDTSAVPGRFFEMPDHFRIGMGVNTEMFAEGLNRIDRALACDAVRN